MIISPAIFVIGCLSIILIIIFVAWALDARIESAREDMRSSAFARLDILASSVKYNLEQSRKIRAAAERIEAIEKNSVIHQESLRLIEEEIRENYRLCSINSQQINDHKALLDHLSNCFDALERKGSPPTRGEHRLWSEELKELLNYVNNQLTDRVRALENGREVTNEIINQNADRLNRVINDANKRDDRYIELDSALVGARARIAALEDSLKGLSDEDNDFIIDLRDRVALLEKGAES